MTFKTTTLLANEKDDQSVNEVVLKYKNENLHHYGSINLQIVIPFFGVSHFAAAPTFFPHIFNTFTKGLQ